MRQLSFVAIQAESNRLNDLVNPLLNRMHVYNQPWCGFGAVEAPYSPGEGEEEKRREEDFTGCTMALWVSSVSTSSTGFVKRNNEGFAVMMKVAGIGFAHRGVALFQSAMHVLH